MEHALHAVQPQRCCVVGEGGRFSPYRRPRPYRTNTAKGQWHRILKFIFTYFESCGARPARFPPRGTSADRAQSTRAAQCGLGVVVLLANEGALLPMSSAQTLTNQHSDSSVAQTSEGHSNNFESCGARLARFPPRGVSANHPQNTCAAQCGLGVVVLWAGT